MAYYLVRVTLDEARRAQLEQQLAQGAFVTLRPFGMALTQGLQGARIQPDGRIVWEEEDYCSPPLAMERAAVLDHYFTDIKVETVRRDEGWAAIAELPRLWEASTD